MEKEEKLKKASQLSAQILSLARDSILVHLRFLDVALSRLKPVEAAHFNGVAMDTVSLYYDPLYILQKYAQEPDFGARMYLHMLLHCIFSHSFGYGKTEPALWDLAADIAVENTILEMNLSFCRRRSDEEERLALLQLKAEAGALTAEKLYHYFRKNPPEESRRLELHWLFAIDSHELWKPRASKEEMVLSKEQWKKISERVKADLKSFSAGKTNSESLEKNLMEATKDRYDYADLLRRFTVMGEQPAVNEDEFDYIYYTYGLSHYGNLPLVEPLEYKETKKVKEFVIVLDTSASCRGPLVRGFLQKTYSILKGTESFFTKVNVHILQCDNEVRSDAKITSDRDFEDFLEKEKIRGFGSTDFRPAFSYVDDLLFWGEFENLKGLIYFTDGYGIYPERMPGYDVIFAFLNEDEKAPEVPTWAIKVILEEEELEA